MKTISIFILIFLSSFSLAHASLEITEIMYDPEGSDSNREWVEIYNNGSSSIAISDWYFFENDTNHGLYSDSFTKLGGGEYALIVKDIDTAQTELGSSLQYIKSSFSLNNTGEELALADPDKNIKDTLSYSSDDGANGTGESLQKIGNDWVSSHPTPGEINEESDSLVFSDDEDDSDNNTETTKKSIIQETYYKGSIAVPRVIVAQSDFNIKAEVFRIKGTKQVRELDGYYLINFGDGKSITSDERIDIDYRYRTSGNYSVVFEYYHSKLAFDAGEEAIVTLEKNILVTEHNISIVDVNNFNGLVLQNNTNKRIDISDWKIIWNNYRYTFPRNSYINSKNKMYVLYSTLGFKPKPSHYNVLQILSNAYKPIDIYPHYIPTVKKTYEKKEILLENSLPETIETDFFNQPNSYLDTYLEDNPDKVVVDFGDRANTDSQTKNNNPLYYALGALVVMLGAARLYKRDSSKKETENFGTIEIIE